jgi:two-component system, OmpR family, KDP operon response regulator KdpE
VAARVLPDVIVLDLGLPDMDGIEVIHGLRGWTAVPIVVLSGRSESGDKVDALDAGADDYVTKPFGMEELLARLRVTERRKQSFASSGPVHRIAGKTIDVSSRTVTADDGTDVHLTPTEWGILEVLVRRPGALVRAVDLMSQVWGPGFGGDTGLVRFHLAGLRRKLEADPGHPAHLLTEPGTGYRFQP